MHVDFAVIGGGPGGYSAAFRAADLGLSTLIVEKSDRLGGVCLNVGCIPSKTLLHAAEVIREAKSATEFGITFPEPEIAIDRLRSHKESVVDTLTGGLRKMAKARKVTIIEGTGRFLDAENLSVGKSDGEQLIVHFSHAVIAAGSTPAQIPDIDYRDERIWDSTDALSLKRVPNHLIVLGGGIIGLEMAAVYAELGSKISIVEMTDQLIPPADADLVRLLQQGLKKRYEGIYISTKVTGVEQGERLKVLMEGKKAPEFLEADALLVSVGRRPASKDLGLETLGITPDERGFIPVDSSQITSVKGIYAIGDITGNPMLAHKAVHEGKTAAESAAGLPAAFTPMTIPSVAYTDPEIAWMGLTENEAKEKGIAYEKGSYPWAASGRALSSDAKRGMSKALFDPETGRILGAGIVGKNAGELIAEAVLALEMGSDAADISRSVHAHPTLAETFAGAAEMVHGSITDLLPQKK